jgi:8-hydroxy-5-deazaflavin:NADPH oxidoreductase
MKTGFIGIGKVGFAIASNLQKCGHEIIVGHDNLNSESLKKALEENPSFMATGLQEMINQSDLVFLTTPFQANESVLQSLTFNGKTLIDCTNPVGPGITHGLKSEISGAEMVQQWAPDAKVVKAFNVYGFENFADSSFPNYNVKPVMPIAGDDKNAKAELAKLIAELGFFPKDTGALSQSLHLEHMTLLWVKMVRMNGNPNFVWAYLEK